MPSQTRNHPIDITAVPRTVIRATVDLLYQIGRSVLDETRMPTARANAWEAVCADRQRAQARAELERWLVSTRQPRATAIR